MLLIDCPWCGPRHHSEFTYGADATVVRPAANADERAFFDYVYMRDNPCGPHVEYWHHAQGCRAWLKVERHTLTHEIASVVALEAAVSRR
jgi:heterotetrameric sarcosine oxidase delta subunit